MRINMLFVVLFVFASMTADVQAQDVHVTDSTLSRKFRKNPIDNNNLGDDMVALNENLRAAQDEIDSLSRKSPNIERFRTGIEDYRITYKSKTERIDAIEEEFDIIKEELSKPANDADRDEKISTAESNISRILTDLIDLTSIFDDESSPLTSLKIHISECYSDIKSSREYNDLMDINSYNYDDETYCKTIDDLERLRDAISITALQRSSKDALALIDTYIANQNFNLTLIEDRVTLLKSRINAIKKKISEEDGDINSLAIKLGLPLFSITILGLFFIPLLGRLINRRNNQNNDPGRSHIVTLEISTVFLITMTILILGLSGILKNEILGTLLGAIAGYVLNSTRKAASDPVTTTTMKSSGDQSISTTTVASAAGMEAIAPIEKKISSEESKKDDINTDDTAKG